MFVNLTFRGINLWCVLKFFSFRQKILNPSKPCLLFIIFHAVGQRGSKRGISILMNLNRNEDEREPEEGDSTNSSIT